LQVESADGLRVETALWPGTYVPWLAG